MIGIELNAFDSLNDKSISIIDDTQRSITGAQEDELLNLKYKKVYILPCQKEKILLPAHVFNKNTLGDMYRICLQPQKNDILLYRKIKAIDFMKLLSI